MRRSHLLVTIMEISFETMKEQCFCLEVSRCECAQLVEPSGQPLEARRLHLCPLLWGDFFKTWWSLSFFWSWPMWSEHVVDDTCQEEVWPEFDCSCQRLNISSSARVQEYHPGICLSSKYHPDIYLSSKNHPGIYLSSKYHPGIYFSSKYHPGIYLCLTTNWEQTPALDDYKHCKRNNGPIVLEP